MHFNVNCIPKLCLKAFFHFHVFRLHFCARLLSPTTKFAEYKLRNKVLINHEKTGQFFREFATT
jgi:hypothetical protein